MKHLAFWFVLRSAFFVTVSVLAWGTWTIGAVSAVAFTLVHAETIREGRLEERERHGRWRND